jgi:hypothetical protein
MARWSTGLDWLRSLTLSVFTRAIDEAKERSSMEFIKRLVPDTDFWVAFWGYAPLVFCLLERSYFYAN